MTKGNALSESDLNLTPAIKVARNALQDKLGYAFKDKDLLAEALTHPSAIKQNQDIKHNQRLEFLGDRVIGLVIADTLFSSTNQEREGILTRRYADCVENARLGHIARDLDIGPAMVVQSNTSLQDIDKVLADALEALIGAIWRDGGMDAARPVILKIWGPLIAGNVSDVKDAKTKLQEYAHKHKISTPRYKIIERTGPDHAPLFKVMVSCGEEDATAEGSSKRLAEQAAAELWLAQNAGQ